MTTSNWDANRAMSACSSASDYASICAGKREGDPVSARVVGAASPLPRTTDPLQGSPNTVRVRACSTQGLTNREAAQEHLEAHMRQINPDYQASLTDEATMLARVPVEQWEVRHSGRPDETFTVRGYTGVYGVLSHDMGGFRTKIDEHALDEVLATDPDVHFVWDHDTRYVGARTRNGTMTLSSDSYGLFMDAQVGPYSWAKDLRTALERGDIDQASMAIQIAADEWAIDEQTDELIRTVTKASGLFDVTVTAQGAFPQTSLAVAYSLLESVKASGRLPQAGATLVAPGEGEPASQPGVEVPTWARELRNRWAVHRDEVAALIERSKAL